MARPKKTIPTLAQIIANAGNDPILFLDVSSVAIGVAKVQQRHITHSGQVELKGKLLSERLRVIRDAINWQMTLNVSGKWAAVVIEEPFSTMQGGKTSAAVRRACVGAWGAAVSALPHGVPIFIVNPRVWQSYMLGGVMPHGIDTKGSCHTRLLLQFPLYKRIDPKHLDNLDALCIAVVIMSAPDLAKRI